MELWEILLLGAALAVDAMAVGVTDGIAEPHMRPAKTFAIAAAFAFFQFAMPVLGYYGGYAFFALLGKFTPYLSFALLLLLGAKMIAEGVMSAKRGRSRLLAARKKLSAGRLFLQAIATSLDALAVGLTFLTAERRGGLPCHVLLCSLIIGVVTLLLVLPAVRLGRKLSFAEGAEGAGGSVLIVIGLKILLEGLL